MRTFWAASRRGWRPWVAEPGCESAPAGEPASEATEACSSDTVGQGWSAPEFLASVIISTYNRRDALVETLRALGKQTVPAVSYEIVVVDDGSTDRTEEAVTDLGLPCTVRSFRHPVNQGVSAGRNLAIRNASGRYLILLSDDVIVPDDFIALHVETLKRFPGFWVVGGFRQLPSLRETPFGRYLDDLEGRFTEARKLALIDRNIWELNWPTARNLSLPLEDLAATGLFDERFRVTCEDQDLAQRARQVGIRFLYNDDIACLHNDQAGDLARYCRFQRRGAIDTVRLCAKYPEVHGGSPLITVNGYVTIRDGLVLAAKKVVKRLLSAEPIMAGLMRWVRLLERSHLPETALRRLYCVLIGLSIFRGWREGLRGLERERVD
jgi:GT2 family glycosyltransferase